MKKVVTYVIYILGWMGFGMLLMAVFSATAEHIGFRNTCFILALIGIALLAISLSRELHDTWRKLHDDGSEEKSERKTR